MIKYMSLIALFFISISSFADVSVQGYTRQNGTYVAPYVRSSPNHNFNDNWSTKPNVNPYTGSEGQKVSPPNQQNYNSQWPSPTYKLKSGF